MKSSLFHLGTLMPSAREGPPQPSAASFQSREASIPFLQMQALSTSPLVYHKAEDLIAILETGELDRGLVNALLRQMMTGVTVDYRSGKLVFRWLHGGESEAVFGWPDEEPEAVGAKT